MSCKTSFMIKLFRWILLHLFCLKKWLLIYYYYYYKYWKANLPPAWNPFFFYFTTLGSLLFMNELFKNNYSFPACINVLSLKLHSCPTVFNSVSIFPCTLSVVVVGVFSFCLPGFVFFRIAILIFFTCVCTFTLFWLSLLRRLWVSWSYLCHNALMSFSRFT